MPIRYVCSNCGYVLYDSRKHWEYLNMYGIPDPSTVAAMYSNRCPKCGKPLKKDVTIDDVVVKR